MAELNDSPKGKILVVCGNIEEVFKPEDNKSIDDLRVIAKRTAAFCPYVPDVFLAQEVNKKSATTFASLLSKVLGAPFEVAVAAEKHDHDISQDQMKQTMRDTAIILNSKTMRRITPGRFFPTKPNPRDVPAEIQHLTLEHAHVLAGKRRSRLKLALASVHFVRHDSMPPNETTYDYKRRWLEQIDDFLIKTYGERSQIRVMAGDLNLDRPVRRPERVKSKERAFWTTMTASRGYLDAVFSCHSSSDEALRTQFRRGEGEPSKKRVDFIFVHGNVEEASHDLEYGAREGEPGYGSQHRMLYAVVAQRRVR